MLYQNSNTDIVAKLNGYVPLVNKPYIVTDF